MATTVPKKVVDRFSSKLKKFQPILRYALDRDVNESDTVDITTDILGELFGYEKFVEVTSEYKIRGTHCDLAIEINGQVRILIEVKAVGIELNERHLRQAVNYAANKGVDWVVLTNGAIWRVYLVEFTKPIKAELVMEIDLLKLSTRKTEDFGPLFLLSREGIGKSALPDFYAQKQATSRFILGAFRQSSSYGLGVDPLCRVDVTTGISVGGNSGCVPPWLAGRRNARPARAPVSLPRHHRAAAAPRGAPSSCST